MDQADSLSGGAAAPTLLELRRPPSASHALRVASACLPVAAVGIVGTDLHGETLPTAWLTALEQAGRVALALAVLSLLIGALYRPRRGGRVEFHTDHFLLPRRIERLQQIRISYADVTGAHPWSFLWVRLLAIGVRGRFPRSLRARELLNPKALCHAERSLRAGVAALPDGAERLRSLDRRAATAIAISQGSWWVTIGLMVLLSAVFLTQLQLRDADDPWQLVAFGANYRSRASGELYRLVTANLLHVNGLHFTMNALTLLALGRLYEPLLGGTRLTVVLAGSGLAGALAAAFAHPERASLGASTLAYGLMGCGVHLAWRFANDLPVYLHFPPRAWRVIALLVLGTELAIPNVDHAGHAAGFGAGLAVSALVARGTDLARIAHATSRSVRTVAAALVFVLTAGLVVGVARGWSALGS